MGILRGLVVCGAIALVVACSSSSSSSAPPSTDCGPGPYVKLTGSIFEANLSGTALPKEGVTISFSICPDKSYTTDATGTAVVNVTKSTPMLIKLEHPDDVPAYLGEWQTDVDFTGSAQVLPKLVGAAVAPGFGPDKTVVGFGIRFPPGTVPSDASTDPCLQVAGVTFAIPGHPEAKIAYLTADSVPKPDATLTATTTIGLATVEGLPDGVAVTPTATKPGCTLTSQVDGFTGRIVPKNGFAVEHFFQLRK